MRAASAMTARSAHGNATPWFEPIGLPNALRLSAYATACSRQACTTPTASAAIATRPSSRIARNCANPRPRSPRRFSSGTRQPLNARPCVSDACQPIFRYGGMTVNPAVPAGTMIAEISPGPVRRGHRDDRGDRRARVGDERLLAVDHPLVRVVVERRGRAGAAGVAAGVGLGEAEAADASARRTGRAATSVAAPRCRTGRSGSRRGRRRPRA